MGVWPKIYEKLMTVCKQHTPAMLIETMPNYSVKK